MGHGVTRLGREGASTGVSGPDAFLIGAPRSGTTTLHNVLGSHPGVLSSRPKEPAFFARDLIDEWAVSDEDAYRACFPPGRRDVALDGTPWYLFSQVAASEIASRVPAARCVAILRDPVTQIPSLHRKHVATGFERCPDLLTAYRSRRHLERPAPGGDFRESIPYRTVSRYAEQLERFIDALGRDRIEVVLFEDLLGDPQGTVSRIEVFLGLSPRSIAELPARNQGDGVRSMVMARLTRSLRGPALWAPWVVRAPAARLRWYLKRANAAETQRHTDPRVLGMIRDDYLADVIRLQGLLDRDLSGWLARGR